MGERKTFNVKVGVHRNLSLYWDTLSREFTEGLPMELLYVDNLTHIHAFLFKNVLLIELGKEKTTLVETK